MLRSKAARRCLAGIAAAGGAALALAAAAPYAGLGTTESFLLYRWAGLTRSDVAGAALLALAACAGALLLAAAHAVVTGRWQATSSWGPLRWAQANLVPGAVLTLVALALLAVGAEAWLTATIPFRRATIEHVWRDGVGFVLPPGREVRWTNGIDFWTRTRANALGLADREPPAAGPPPEGTCRIALIGDSFVEALQVETAQKAHVVLESLLARDRPGRRVEAFAVGQSGTGQANQIAYVEAFARPRRPAIVVLVLVENDLVNNSFPLQALEQRWSPDRMPLAQVRPGPGGGFVLVEPSPDWRAGAIQEITGRPLESGQLRSRAHQLLADRSHAYDRLYRLLDLEWPAAAAVLAGRSEATGYVEAKRRLMGEVARRAGDGALFDGWHWPEDLGEIEMFHAEPMPRVFEAAVAATDFAIGELVRRARQDGSHVLLLAAYGVSRRFSAEEKDAAASRHGRRLRDAGQLQRFAAIARRHGVALLAQADYIAEVGGRIEDAHFRRDGHWSAQGHRWAAEQLARAIDAAVPGCGGKPG